MPNYDYKCIVCGYTFEYFQSMLDEPLSDCPKCKGTLRRLIGAGAGAIFKGSGFYQTDYKNAGRKDEKVPKSANNSKQNIKKSKNEK